MDPASVSELAFLAMYAEDMHRATDTGPQLLGPTADPRLLADYDIKAYLVANDSIFSLGSRVKVSPEAVFYGYVAQKKSDQSWIVAIRGTSGIVEWIIDGQFLPQPSPRGVGQVEHGFWSIYETMILTEPDGVSLLDNNAALGISNLVGADGLITVVGHSLGSALATYLSFDLVVHVGDRVGACLFASPRTGNKEWVDAVSAKLGGRFLVVNYLIDLVPQLPTGPDYATAEPQLILRPSTAQAGIKVDPMSDHHVLCYAAMLSFATFSAHEGALLPVDASERESILGDASTVPEEAKILEHLVDAGAHIFDPGTVLRTINKFGLA